MSAFLDQPENELARTSPLRSIAQRPAASAPARPAGAEVHRRWTPLRLVAAALVVFVLVSVFFLDQEEPPQSAPLPAIPVAQRSEQEEPPQSVPLPAIPVVQRSEQENPPRSAPLPAIPIVQRSEPSLGTVLKYDAAGSTIGGAAPATWTDLSISVQYVEPGAAFTTDQPWYTVYDGPLVLMVLDGALDLRTAGPALFYPAGNADQPQTIQPGSLLHLSLHDAVVYATKDGAFGSNPGNSPMVALVGLAGQFDPSVPGSNVFPENVDVEALDVWSPRDPAIDVNALDNWSPLGLTGDGTSISLLQQTLAPLDMYVFDPDPNWRYLVTFDPAGVPNLRVYDGALESFDLSGGHASWKLQDLGEGPHTLANLGDSPIDLYFMVVEEDSDAGSTPA